MPGSHIGAVERARLERRWTQRLIVYFEINDKAEQWMKAFEKNYKVQMSITRSFSKGCHVLKIYGPRSKELHDKLVDDERVEYHGLEVIYVHKNCFALDKGKEEI
jgi:hypothetical protein